MPKSFLVKKYSNDSHWNSSKWSKLYSVPSSSSTSAADINSASLLLNLSSSGGSSSNHHYLNGNKTYSSTEHGHGSNSIYNLTNKQRNYESLNLNNLKQQQKARFLLPPNKQNHHIIHVNGNHSTNGNHLKTSFNHHDKSTDDQQTTTVVNNKQDSFKKLLPTTNSSIGRPQKLIKYPNNSEQAKRQIKPPKVQITKENTTNDQQDEITNQKKNEGNLFVFLFILFFILILDL